MGAGSVSLNGKESIPMKPFLLIVAMATLLGSTLEAQIEFSINSDGSVDHSFLAQPWASFQTDTLASTGTQGAHIGNLTADFSTNKTFTISFSAPTGSQFVVDPTAWLGKGDLRFKMEFRTGSQASPFYAGNGVFQWIGATGIAPSVTREGEGFTSDQTFSVGTNTNISSQAISFATRSTSVMHGFTFTGFTYTLTAPEEFTQVFNDAAWMMASIKFEVFAPAGAVSSDPGSVVSLQAVPEPNTFVMLGIGGMALAFLRRKG